MTRVLYYSGVNIIAINHRILYIQYTNPGGYPPLEHSSRILAREGWQVLFLGRDIEGTGDLVFPPHPCIDVRYMPDVKGGWSQKVHYIRFVCWGLGMVLLRRPAWVYASDVLSCPVAWICSFIPNIRVLYHEHDAPQTNSYHTSPISGFMQTVLIWRYRLAHRARACIIPNRQRLQHFLQETDTKSQTFCVWNCPSKEEVSPMRRDFRAGALRLFYHGSIVPDRLPFTVLNALAQLPSNVRLSVVGYETGGHPGYIQALKSRADQLDIADRITFIGAVPRQDLLIRCADSDIGLAFVPAKGPDINLQTMIGASNKPFDYLACGLALLVSDLPDWTKMYVEPGYGLACNIDDPEDIVTSLQWYLAHPKEMRAMGEAGRRRILNEWNYEHQFAPVLDVLTHG